MAVHEPKVKVCWYWSQALCVLFIYNNINSKVELPLTQYWVLICFANLIFICFQKANCLSYVEKVDLTAYVEKHEFCFDAVLDENVTNDEVRLLLVKKWFFLNLPFLDCLLLLLAIYRSGCLPLFIFVTNLRHGCFEIIGISSYSRTYYSYNFWEDKSNLFCLRSDRWEDQSYLFLLLYYNCTKW